MLFIAFTIFLGEIGNPKRGNGLASAFRVLVLNSSKLFLASDLGFTGIPESGFRGPGLRGLDLGFWVSGGLGPCFTFPETPFLVHIWDAKLFQWGPWGRSPDFPAPRIIITASFFVSMGP